MRYEPSNNQIIVTGIKIYQPLFEAFTGCLAGLFLAPEETWLGRAAATSSAMSETFVSVAWAKVFLQSGQAVISSSGKSTVRVRAASAAISALLPEEIVMFPGCLRSIVTYSLPELQTAVRPHSLSPSWVRHRGRSPCQAHKDHDKQPAVQVTQPERTFLDKKVNELGMVHHPGFKIIALPENLVAYRT